MFVFALFHPLSFIHLIFLSESYCPERKEADLILPYNLPAFADNNRGAFLNGVARLNNLKEVCTPIFSAPQASLTRPKTAEPDQMLAARIVLRG